MPLPSPPNYYLTLLLPLQPNLSLQVLILSTPSSSIHPSAHLGLASTPTIPAVIFLNIFYCQNLRAISQFLSFCYHLSCWLVPHLWHCISLVFFFNAIIWFLSYLWNHFQFSHWIPFSLPPLTPVPRHSELKGYPLLLKAQFLSCLWVSSATLTHQRSLKPGNPQSCSMSPNLPDFGPRISTACWIAFHCVLDSFLCPTKTQCNTAETVCLILSYLYLSKSVYIATNNFSQKMS